MALSNQTSFGKFCQSFIFLVGAIGFVQSAHAQDDNWYVDLGYQVSDFEGEDEFGLANLDATLSSLQGHIGYRALPFLAVEGEFGLGVSGEKDAATYDPNLDFFAPPPQIGIKQPYVAGLSGRLQHSFGDHVLVFAKGGVAQSEFKVTRTVFTDIAGMGPSITTTKTSETGAVYGVGSEIYFNENIGLRLDLTQYDWGEFENRSVSLGLSHRF